MAVRDALFWNGTTFEEMDFTERSLIIAQAIYAYSQNPAVTLSVVASGGSLDAMVDRRYEAGAATSDATDFDTEAETPDISAIDTTYDKIDETVTVASQPVDTNNIKYPVFYDSATNKFQAMTQTDFYDTYIDTAITNLVASYSSTSQGGTYYMSNSNSVAGMTLVSATPVFIDTRADADLYTAAGIPEDTDQPETINSYYLHQIDGADVSGNASFQMPLYATSSGNLQQYSVAELNTILEEMMLYHTSSVVGDRITYNINGTGTNRGSAADTYLSGTSADGYNTLQVGDDYRTQEFPNGTPATLNTYFLRINRS